MCACRGASNSLQVVLLLHNKLSGTIPKSWAAMLGLLVLNVEGNQLTGTIPSMWASKALNALWLPGNKLTGSLPVWPAPNLGIYHVGARTNAKCEGNLLSGSIPGESLARLMPRLTELMLLCNTFSGTLPADMVKLSKLLWLDVSSNPLLQGTIPESFGQLSKLEMLVVSDTSISGTIPKSIGDLQSLKVVDFSNSKLSGCIPASLAGQRYSIQVGSLSRLAVWKTTTNLTGLC